MSLSKFSANLAYTSAAGIDYTVNFTQGKDNKEAAQVLIDTVEHLAWVAAIAGQSNAVKEALNSGLALGDMRRAELDQKKFEVTP